VNREVIYTALFNLLQGIDGIETFSRILAHWDDVSASQQPALYMTVVSQRAEQVTGLPTKYVLDAKIWLYTHRDSAGEIPSVAINRILDALDAALKPLPGPSFKQTLGGLVEHCWIDGEIGTDEGTLGAQSVAIVPVRMLVVAS
jgi:hypothetical protein